MVKKHIPCLKAAMNTLTTTHWSYFNAHCIPSVLWKEKNGNKGTQRTSSRTRHNIKVLPEIFNENNKRAK